jgi:hypothetical protein
LALYGSAGNVYLMKCPRLIVAIFAALAMTVLVNARFAFSQEEPESGTSVDANWDRTGPGIDENAETANKVLEIPQATCTGDTASVPCDAAADANDDDGTQAINAPSPGAPPQVLDDDTASSGAPDQDWGDADDYKNQQVYAVPYAVYPYPYPATVARSNSTSAVPASAYAPLSSPITQAARPPLNQGPWMNPPTMSAFGRPAGSPMMGMASSPFGFHH